MKVIVDGLAVEYVEEGSGPVLLMLHGWKDSLYTFDAIVQELTKKFRIIRFDLPGFGQSERPKEDWNVGNYADFVAVFCKKLHVEPEVLVGHSLGGRIAIKIVAEKKLLPKKLVLIASAGIAKKHTIKSSLLRVVAQVAKAATSVPPISRWQYPLRKRLYDRLGSDYFAAGGMKGTYLKVIAEDLQSTAAKLATPTLLIYGTKDESTPLAYGQRFHELIKGSRLEVIDGAGHFVHQERADEVARMIEQFV